MQSQKMPVSRTSAYQWRQNDDVYFMAIIGGYNRTQDYKNRLSYNHARPGTKARVKKEKTFVAHCDMESRAKTG